MKTKEELKTLKDLKDCECSSPHLIRTDILKQEAIKWVKYFRKKYEEIDGIDEFKFSQAVYIQFMIFFDLTLDDLK